MNMQSFEYDLRHLRAPAFDPASRDRAREAALQEFERTHAMPAAMAAATGSRLQPTTARNSRSGWWGGLATACVAVVGVAMYWLLPPADRAVQLQPASQPITNAQRSDEDAPPQVDIAVAPSTERTPPPSRQQESAKAPALRTQIAPADASVPVTLVEERQKAASVQATTRAADKSVVTPSLAPPPPAPQGSAATSTSGGLSEAVIVGSRNSVATLASIEPVPMLREAENRDKFQHFETNPVKLANEQPVSTFSVDVDTASYSFVRRQLNQGVLPPADSVRVEEMVNYFDYSWPVPSSRDRPFEPMVAVSDSPWGKGRKLVHIGIKGYEVPAAQRPDVNLVLLLDVSGSMDSPDKLPLAQRSMALLLDSLKPTDTVAIVVYAGAAGQVLAPTPVREKETILTALNSLRPGGSTAGAAGIQLAYELAERNFRKGGINRILLATDGDFNVGISDREALKSYVEHEREKGVYLSVLGFGEGNYRDEMAQALAQNGNGVAVYIDTLNEARKVLVQQASAALFTIAKDVKLQVEFNARSVAEYRLVGYESRALNRDDFNNDKVDAGDVGAGHTVTAIYEITPVGSPARMIEDRRYAEQPSIRAQQRSASEEYGYLKIRYKLPDSRRSRLLELPIRANAGVPPRLKQDVEFSAAVAGFAQLLRGGRYTGTLTFDDVLRQAQASRGEDPYGYRAEFVQLVRLAEQARGM